MVLLFSTVRDLRGIVNYCFNPMTIAVALLLALPSVSLAQQRGPSTQNQGTCQIDGQQLKELVDEVRRLRQEMRRVGIVTHRLLLLSDQNARQQAKVDGLTREIERLRSQLNSVEETSKDDEALKEIETALSETVDPKARVQLIQAHAAFKSAFEKQKKRNEEFAATTRVKLQQLEYKLGEEQDRLSSLKEEMERLNQEMDKLAVEREKKG